MLGRVLACVSFIILSMQKFDELRDCPRGFVKFSELTDLTSTSSRGTIRVPSPCWAPRKASCGGPTESCNATASAEKRRKRLRIKGPYLWYKKQIVILLVNFYFLAVQCRWPKVMIGCRLNCTIKKKTKNDTIKKQQ